MVVSDQARDQPEERKRLLSDVVLGLVFAIMITGSGIALYYDFRSLSLTGDGLPGFLRPGVEATPMRAPRTDDQVRRYDPRVAPERGPLDVVELPGFDGNPDDAIGRPMEFFLGLDGRATAIGRIGIGAFDGFARFLDNNPDVISLTFHSPGGSVRDAMAMAERLREDELNTHIAAFGYCASSCPLAFSGGVERTVTGEVWFGVHQVFTSDAQVGTLQDGMAGAQHISSQAQQLLDDMGVDPRAWIHAMATPKEELYLFTDEELEDYSWVTQ
jgi:hypothetical protein